VVSVGTSEKAAVDFDRLFIEGAGSGVA
jgi:hypothetical protein